MSEDQMDDFERGLARALKRVDSPEGFALRVIERAEKESTQLSADLPQTNVRAMPISRMRPVFRVWFGSAIAAVLAMGVFAGERVHERRQQERAQQQFEAAMRVTDHALDQTRAKLERAGLRLGD